MLFSYRDIGEQSRTYLENWFKKKETLKPLFDLYFGVLHNKQTYLDHKLLSLVQALESYHRRVFKTTETSKEEHEARLQEIFDATPEKHRSWLQRKLKHSNELSLQNRLIELVDVYKELLCNFIQKPGEFTQQIADNRNYLTHYDPRLTSRAIRDSELYAVTEKLKVLVELFLLRELGVDDASIKKIIEKRIRNILELLNGPDSF
ncbi:hypothetical protein NTE_00003 [Candidatus Nitrososphaera evergladensis SR1]|uniref:Apea-like HEPN domain-containing protein n=2 Tax=Nitrososphaera TaxID=497726 RepID=A0A075MMM4_9ARCH|nr:hypothetical protein NTE_00003 [Candidatus Nitrososphaera evergladensis SR1]